MTKEIIYKNGGFPPIKYCKPKEMETKKNSKERFFNTAARNDINIRQILATKNKSDNIFIDNTIKEDDMTVLDSL